MTTVDQYRPPELSDVPPTIQSNFSRTARIARIPPAVPSPPSTRDSPPQRKPNHPKKDHTSDMTLEDLGQWLFTDAELAHTPSIRDGISITEERSRRAKGVNFIVQAGVYLKLPQITLATASIFFHRFYMRSSMVVENNKIGCVHHYNIAATALFLATKTEENCRKTKEIVIAVAKVAQKNASLIIDEQSKEYWRWRDSILLYEEVMLEQLTFDVCLQSPYNHLFDYVHKLGIEENKQLRNTAWAFLNDSQLTVMCLRLKPSDIAIASIYFAAKHCKEHIPDGEDGTPWWEILNGSPDLIVKAVDIISAFYTDNPLKRSDNPYTGSPNSNTEADIARTRQFFNINTPRSDAGANGSADHETQSPANGTNGTRDNVSQNMEKQNSSEPGSSDARLKEAANDPITHENTAVANGAHEAGATDTQTTSLSQSSKRKSPADPLEAPANKVAKTSEASGPTISTETNAAKFADGASAGQTENYASEGEEGELEE